MSCSADDELAVRARERIGEVLCGTYRLERVLGIGAVTAVYRAVDRTGRHVAIKVLHADLSRSSEIRERFVHEGLAANAARHPGVVEVIDADIAEDGSAFLVMELLSGQSLDAICETSAHLLDTQTVLALASELCAVLAAAHRVGIVHRDIKPSNLFVTDAGRLKVLDFGVAATGMVHGSPSFMAPEQANGRTNQIDARTDVWAAGATMFMLLSGRPVHEGETAQHIALLAATQPARLLMTVAPRVPATVAAIVDRALARDRTMRWGSAAEMWTAIGGALHEAPNVLLRELMTTAAQARTRMIEPWRTGIAIAPTEVRINAGPTVRRRRASSMAPQRPSSSVRRSAVRIALPIVLGLTVIVTWLGARNTDAWGRSSKTTTNAAVIATTAPPPPPPPPTPPATTTASAAPAPAPPARSHHGADARPPTRRGSATPTHSVPSRPIAGASAR